VIGDKVVDAMEGSLDPELSEMWTWAGTAVSEGEDFDGDGSRSGERRSNLKDELAKTNKASRSSVL
jgi:sarcosine oxidase/L-pipecolate oxidase